MVDAMSNTNSTSYTLISLFKEHRALRAKMLKFTSGIVVGWVACRSLHDDQKALLPTLDELIRLREKATNLYIHTLKKIEEYEKK